MSDAKLFPQERIREEMLALDAETVEAYRQAYKVKEKNEKRKLELQLECPHDWQYYPDTYEPEYGCKICGKYQRRIP